MKEANLWIRNMAVSRRNPEGTPPAEEYPPDFSGSKPMVYNPQMHSEDSLTKHFRLTPAHLAALRKLGIAAVRDLLYHFPSRYDRSGQESAIAGLAAGQEATLFGTLEKLETRRSWKRKIPVGQAKLRDSSGTITVMWFHQPYLAKKFREGAFVKAVGVIGGAGAKLYLANPHVELADPAQAGIFKTPAREDTQAQFFAVYPESRGVSSLWLRHAVVKVLRSGILENMNDPIPEDIRARYHLPDLRTALVWIHEPDTLKHAEAARKRFSFEEMFAIQIARALERRENDAESAPKIENAREAAEKFLSTIPYPPTSAQARAIEEILADFGRGHPMARLLEGDVGSGKTLVAAATCYAVVTSRPPGRQSGNLQVAYMAPTEILAAQHFQSFIEYFRDLPIGIGLLTGSGCKKFPSKTSPDKATDISRAQLLKWVASGEIAILLGTHALVQKSVTFQHLAYAIVDEQHRFGVRQRRALAQKSAAGSGSSGFPKTMPHFLSMTATPIPRTLALTIWGDLDISVLDELPPGRAKIETKLIKPNGRAQAYEAIRAQLREGRQAYVICPRIEEPDPENQSALQARSAKAEAARLKKDIFPEFEIGLLHGAMTPKEKDAAMGRFASGKTNVLVATSVVEVGVNVPNATVILIEGAERFGLSQLHQLRGRVMRSSHPPSCFLLSESGSDISLKRLRALERSADGFALAEVDLESRGAGDMLGGRQWGVSDLGMEALKNPRLTQASRQEARGLVAADPALSKHPALAARIRKTAEEFHAE